MGGFINPSTTIGGTVLAPGIPFAGSPLSGLYSANNGLGLSLNGISAYYQSAVAWSVGEAFARNGVLVNVAGSPFASGVAPYKIAHTPDGVHVIIANNTSQTISVMQRNAVTGALAHVFGSPFAVDNVGNNPYGVAVSPDGRHLYVAYNSSNAVSAYSINPVSGAITPVAGSPFAQGVIAFTDVKVSPDGAHVITIGQGAPGTVNVWSRNPVTGVLAAVAGSPFACVGTPISSSISPDGLFVQVSDSTGNQIVIYARNPVSGLLTQIAGSPFACVGAPQESIVSPDGAHLIVAGFAAGNVGVYARNIVNGSIAAVVGSPFASGGSASGATISPDGAYVFISNSAVASVSSYSRNAATGFLTPVAGSPFATGNTPFYCSVSPDGQHLAVSQRAPGNIQVFKTSSTNTIPLLSALFDPLGGGYGSINLNGQLFVNGMPVASAPPTAGAIGKFLRVDITGATIWDGVNTYIPVAMVANAGAFSVDDTAEYIVEVTGALTAPGALTPTFTVPADPLKIVFDNVTTGGFPLVLAGTYTLPPGRSYWYWNGATLEMLSSGGFRTANVTPLPAAGSVIALNHLCGSVPKNVQIEMVCLTAENGYAIGDVVNANAQYNGAATSPLNYWLSATQMGFTLIALYTLTMGSKTTGAIVTPTAANWAYRFMVQP